MANAEKDIEEACTRAEEVITRVAKNFSESVTRIRLSSCPPPKVEVVELVREPGGLLRVRK